MSNRAVPFSVFCLDRPSRAG